MIADSQRVSSGVLRECLLNRQRGHFVVEFGLIVGTVEWQAVLVPLHLGRAGALNVALKCEPENEGEYVDNGNIAMQCQMKEIRYCDRLCVKLNSDSWFVGW